MENPKIKVLGQKLQEVLESFKGDIKSSNNKLSALFLYILNSNEDCFKLFLRKLLKNNFVNRQSDADLIINISNLDFIIEIKRKIIQNKEYRSIYINKLRQRQIKIEEIKKQLENILDLKGNCRVLKKNKSIKILSSYFLKYLKDNCNYAFIHGIEDPYAQVSEYYLHMKHKYKKEAIPCILHYSITCNNLKLKIEEIKPIYKGSLGSFKIYKAEIREVIYLDLSI